MIRLDGIKMKDHDSLHIYLKEKLNLSKGYGGNLDALWDELMERTESLNIYIENTEQLLENIGEYGVSLLDLFFDLAKENTNISVDTDFNTDI